MSDLRYIVKKQGRPHAAFVFAADAEAYIHSEVATMCFDKPLYGPKDYTIEEVGSGRQVVGTTGHGNAILAALDRPSREGTGRDT